MEILGATTSTQETASTIHRQAFVVTSIVLPASINLMILAMAILSSATTASIASQVENEAHALIMVE